MSGGHIYILGSHTGTLYIGVTSNLYVRVMQHKEGAVEGFTATMAANACSILRVTRTFAQRSLAKNNSKAGGARKSSSLFTRSIPSSKTLHGPGDGR
jgi:predicted GIY-YIG superfamily endonuclease